MKDLAAQDYSSKSKVTISRGAIKLAGFAILILFAIFFVKSKLSSGSSSGGSNASINLSEAPRGLTPVSVDNSNLSAKGVDLASQNASMKIVRSEISGSAKATRSYGGGTFILLVSATLPDPKANSYEVWLTDGTKIVPVDFMHGSGTSWSLELNDSDKYSKLNEIWITLERTKDSKPEEHYVEGSF